MSSENVTISFIEATYRFLEHLMIVHEMSVHTVRCYASDLNHLKEYMEEEQLNIPKNKRACKISYKEKYKDRDSSFDDSISFEDLKRRMIRRFLRNLGRRMDCRTIGRHVSTLKSFFKFVMIQRIVTENPMKHIDKPKAPKLIPYYVSYDQIEELMNQADTRVLIGFRDRCFMELLYCTGIRVSELANLNRKDFNEAESILHIRGKGERERLIPVTDTASKWLKDYLTHPERFVDGYSRKAEVDHEAIFLNRTGERISTRSVGRRFEIYTSAIGLREKVTPHTLRHAIATHWLENGMDIKTIKVLLGHESFSMTTIYTQVSTKLKKEVHTKAALIG